MKRTAAPRRLAWPGAAHFVLAAGIALAAATFVTPAAADAPAPPITLRSEWPSYLGPCGNFSERSDAKLLDDMTRVRLAWQSEEKAIGFGKATSAAGKSGMGEAFLGLPPGGEASPIVAGGLVIMAYFVPRGEVWDATVEKQSGAVFQKSAWLVAADDVVIGIDATTGKTRWKQVFADKGINTGAGKRGGWACTPCAADGKVFALGTTGRVYALDLATGKPLWESDIGPVHKRLEEAKAKGLAARRLALEGSNFRPYGILSVVDGVLLVTDWTGGLLGLDPAGGKTLWHASGKERILSDFNAPCPARVGGKTYVACANARGDLRLIDPKSGQVLWTVAIKCEHLTQPVAGDEHLLVFESNPAIQEGKQEGINQVGVLAAYRFDEKGAKRDWALPAEYAHELKLDAGPSRRVIPRDGLVYYLARSNRDGGAACKMVIIREKDGTVLKSQNVNANQFYLWGDRIVTVSDLQHRPRPANPEIWQLYTADPADFRRLGEGWHVNNPQKPVHTATGGYELPVYEAFADGLMFCRVMGGIRCYDLRR
jgi:hypothetical protein